MSDDNNKVRDAADAIKGIVEAVPVYQDVVQPAAKEVGTALQTVSKTLHILLAPVSALVWGYDQIKDYVGERVGEKLQHIPDEQLQTPEPYIAGPALEALKYTGYQEELREMYASLLATSLDKNTAKSAHPSFVEIIRQMSPDEAVIMKLLHVAQSAPKINVRSEDKKTNVGDWIIKHFSLLPHEANCKNTEIGPTYLVNLQRLGLIEITENYTLAPEDSVDVYAPLLEDPAIKLIINKIEENEDVKVSIEKGAILLTSLGIQFSYACIQDETHVK